MRYVLVILMLVFAQPVSASPLGNTYVVSVKGTDTTVYDLDNSTDRGEIVLFANFYVDQDGTSYFRDARGSRVSKGGVVVQNGAEACALDRGNNSVTRCYSVKVSGDSISITADMDRDWYGEGSVERWVFTLKVAGKTCRVASVKYTFAYRPKPGREDEGFWSKNPNYATRACSMAEGPFSL